MQGRKTAHRAKICILLLAMVLMSNNAEAVPFRPDSAKSYEMANSMNTIIMISAGGAFGASASDFFKQYTSLLEGTNSELLTTPAISAAIKFDLARVIRGGIMIGYYKSDLSNSFYQEVYRFSHLGNRSLTENISIENVPLLALVEYIPYREQFRSYVGFGAGVVGGNISWREYNTTTVMFDPRTGGMLFNKSVVGPAFRVYSGLELGFDKHPEDHFLGSLIFEVSYTYSFRYAKMMNVMKDQLWLPPKDLNTGYHMVPGILGVNMALSFNFNQATMQKGKKRGT